MLHELGAWLRIVAAASAILAIVGLVITAGGPVLELVALR